jgi:protocatechuate 3,4-dioxygenase beta subunit
MNTLQKFSLLAALALAFSLRAATNDAAKFSGTVLDAQGNPVAGATVDLYQYPSRAGSRWVDLEAKQRAVTDGQGAFELSVFNGQGLALVTKAGAAPGWRVWYNAPEEPQKIVLSSSSILAGVVVDNAGKPVADAEVWVPDAINKTPTDYGQQSFVSGKIARELFSTRTSADGKFRIENFPADAQAILLAKKNGKALRPTASLTQNNELPFHAGQDDITLTLDPAGSVAGKVVVRGTGQPLTHAVVSLAPTTPELSLLLLEMGTIVTAADGSFQIPDVPAGSYQVTAIFTNEPIADWVANSVPVTVATGQATPGVQIQCYKGGVLEVTVQGKSNHKPLADAGVSVNSDEFNRSSSTGTNGVAYFRLSPGQFNVYANKRDWSQAQTQTTVTEGQTTQVTIELGEPSKVAGIVRDASGAPVAGASVGLFPNYQGGDTGAKTDANGHYELIWQKPSWAGSANQSVYLVARHLERKLAAMREMEETMTNLNVTLKPAMSVSGRVLDTHGKAVTNGVASIALRLENMSFTISRQPVHSDEQGRIQADALPMGERYGWYVSARGYGGGRVEMDAADPKADHYDFPPIVLKIADRKLAGRVLGTNGAPAAGVQVYINSNEDQVNANATTDANGRFVFDAVCEGAVRLSANFKGASGSAEAMGGDTNVVIRFDARSRVVYSNPTASQKLTGTVYDSSGKPAVGARVVVTPTWGTIDIAKTDAKGEYSVNWQAQPGLRDAKYFAVARDVEGNLAAIEAIDTNKTRVDLRLGPGLSISGTVQDAKGAPLARANINLNMMAGNMGGMVEYQAIKMNSDGTFTIPALPMGQQYRFNVTANGYGSTRKNVGKTQSQTNSIQLTPFKLKAADRQLAGQVLGADDKPLSGAQVNINGNGQPSGNSRTDATGYFKFKVCDGPIQVFAYSPSGAGAVNSGTTYARGGDTNVVVKIGARQQPKIVPREIPLKPQAWTLSAIVTWPAHHKAAAFILLSLQALVLLGTGGGIFWFTRKRG